MTKPEKPSGFAAMPAGMRLFIVAGLMVVVAGIGAIAALLTSDRPIGAAQEGRSTGSPLVGGAFTLVDQDGKTRTQADFAGKLTLVYFGYTFCPDVCPTGLQRLAEGLDVLTEAERAEVVPLFVTIDPARDTSAVLKEYVAQFHPALIGLTGTAEQVAVAAKAYRVYYRKSDQTKDQADYLMDHSSIIFVMGRDGTYKAHFTHESKPEDIAAGIRKTLKG
ncbi:hypothetical protein VZ95_10915 [Elstera litoralis]|uniref:Thioredoxin domain-containing protein n=1 Tax=Elstera litoralis TaxID=552518 RepID=A0A0F3ISI3_9PROT|nr:SCO family protein [Elstera litoralis]KJV09533.1 hypothetical protein VZ95_10915 [Elstera litoralis]